MLDLAGMSIPSTGVWQLAAAFFGENGTLYVGVAPAPGTYLRLSQGYFIPVAGHNSINVVGAGSWEKCQAGEYCFRSGDKVSWNQEFSAFVGIPHSVAALQQARQMLTPAIESSMADQLLSGLGQIAPPSHYDPGLVFRNVTIR